MPLDIGNRLSRDEMPAIQDQHSWTDFFDDPQQVAAEQDRCAVFPHCGFDDLKHFMLSLRIETQRGLIQKEDLRVVYERPCHPLALAHSPPVGGNPSMPGMFQAEHIKKLTRFLCSRFLGLSIKLSEVN